MSSPWGSVDIAGSNIPVTVASSNFKVQIADIGIGTAQQSPYTVSLPQVATVECANLSDMDIIVSFLSGTDNAGSWLIPRRKVRVFHLPSIIRNMVVSLPSVSTDITSQHDTTSVNLVDSNSLRNGYLDVRTSSLVIDISPTSFDDTPPVALDCFTSTGGSNYQADLNPAGTGAPTIVGPVGIAIQGFSLWRQWSMYSSTAQTVSVQLGIAGSISVVTCQLQFLANMVLTSSPELPLPPLFLFSSPNPIQFTGIRALHFI